MLKITTTFGEFAVSWKNGRLHSLHFPDENIPRCPESCEEPENNELLAKWLQQYCDGALLPFPDEIAIDYSGYSDFTKAVLNIVAAIPRGETRTYREVAAAAGYPKAARAAGNAIGSNRVPVIIPCHRVVRADGQIGGFTGGVHWKIKLLQLEKIIA